MQRRTLSPETEAAPREQLREAAALLADGGVVAVPTDTLYGLAANALDEEAVRRVFRVKGREPGEPLPLLLSETAEAHRWAMAFRSCIRASASRSFFSRSRRSCSSAVPRQSLTITCRPTAAKIDVSSGMITITV